MKRNLTIKTYQNNIKLYQENVVGTLEEGILTYSTENDKIMINFNDFVFRKENAETILKIKKDTCILTLKDLGQEMVLPHEYINYMICYDKELQLEYKLISQDEPIKIVLEIGDGNVEG